MLYMLHPLIEVINEARLNLVICYLKNDEVNKACDLIKDVECVVPKEYILKAVVHVVIGQNTDQKENFRIT
jgi:intraflagellar transport protein 56